MRLGWLKQMNLKLTAIALAITGLTVRPVMAGHQLGPVAGPQYGQTDYAPVERVETLTRLVDVPVTREVCYQQPQRYPSSHRYAGYGPASHQSYAPMILGGIIGGVVGNQFGKGGGKDLLTVAGAALGASIGYDQSNRHRYKSGHHRSGYQAQPPRSHCELVTDYEPRHEPDGYQVTYRYNGRTYVTRMNHHPGHQIKVNVNVAPVY